MNYFRFRSFGGKALFLIISFVLLGSALRSLPAQAEDFMIFDVIPANRLKAVSFASADRNVSLVAKKGTSTADVSFKFLSLLSRNSIGNHYELGELEPASDLYYFESSSYLNNDFSARPTISLKFTPENKLISIYYWDKYRGEFVRLEATRDTKKNILTFDIPPVEKIIFGLFVDTPQIGKASWYVHPRFPKELMAASTEFSFGSKVKVTNLANGKEVIVTIKDYGPVKALHPDRVIDLGREAFRKIASTGAGVIDVRVEAYIDPKTATTSSPILKK